MNYEGGATTSAVECPPRQVLPEKDTIMNDDEQEEAAVPVDEKDASSASNVMKVEPMKKVVDVETVPLEEARREEEEASSLPPSSVPSLRESSSSQSANGTDDEATEKEPGSKKPEEEVVAKEEKEEVFVEPAGEEEEETFKSDPGASDIVEPPTREEEVTIATPTEKANEENNDFTTWLMAEVAQSQEHPRQSVVMKHDPTPIAGETEEVVEKAGDGKGDAKVVENDANKNEQDEKGPSVIAKERPNEEKAGGTPAFATVRQSDDPSSKQVTANYAGEDDIAEKDKEEPKDDDLAEPAMDKEQEGTSSRKVKEKIKREAVDEAETKKEADVSLVPPPEEETPSEVQSSVAVNPKEEKAGPKVEVEAPPVKTLHPTEENREKKGSSKEAKCQAIEDEEPAVEVKTLEEPGATTRETVKIPRAQLPEPADCEGGIEAPAEAGEKIAEDNSEGAPTTAAKKPVEVASQETVKPVVEEMEKDTFEVNKQVDEVASEAMNVKEEIAMTLLENEAKESAVANGGPRDAPNIQSSTAEKETFSPETKTPETAESKEEVIADATEGPTEMVTEKAEDVPVSPEKAKAPENKKVDTVKSSPSTEKIRETVMPVTPGGTRKKLAIPAVFNTPTKDKPAPVIRSYSGKKWKVTVPAEIVSPKSMTQQQDLPTETAPPTQSSSKGNPSDETPDAINSPSKDKPGPVMRSFSGKKWKVKVPAEFVTPESTPKQDDQPKETVSPSEPSPKEKPVTSYVPVSSPTKDKPSPVIRSLSGKKWKVKVPAEFIQESKPKQEDQPKETAPPTQSSSKGSPSDETPDPISSPSKDEPSPLIRSNSGKKWKVKVPIELFSPATAELRADKDKDSSQEVAAPLTPGGTPVTPGGTRKKLAIPAVFNTPTKEKPVVPLVRSYSGKKWKVKIPTELVNPESLTKQDDCQPKEIELSSESSSKESPSEGAKSPFAEDHPTSESKGAQVTSNGSQGAESESEKQKLLQEIALLQKRIKKVKRRSIKHTASQKADPVQQKPSELLAAKVSEPSESKGEVQNTTRGLSSVVPPPQNTKTLENKDVSKEFYGKEATAEAMQTHEASESRDSTKADDSKDTVPSNEVEDTSSNIATVKNVDNAADTEPVREESNKDDGHATEGVSVKETAKSMESLEPSESAEEFKEMPSDLKMTTGLGVKDVVTKLESPKPFSRPKVDEKLVEELAVTEGFNVKEKVRGLESPEPSNSKDENLPTLEVLVPSTQEATPPEPILRAPKYAPTEQPMSTEELGKAEAAMGGVAAFIENESNEEFDPSEAEANKEAPRTETEKPKKKKKKKIMRILKPLKRSLSFGKVKK